MIIEIIILCLIVMVAVRPVLANDDTGQVNDENPNISEHENGGDESDVVDEDDREGRPNPRNGEPEQPSKPEPQHPINVYTFTIDDVAEYGEKYLGIIFEELEDKERLLEVFRYPTVIAMDKFGCISYELIPVVRFNKVPSKTGYSNGKSLEALYYHTPFYMRVWLFPYGLENNKVYTVSSVHIIMAGQFLPGNVYNHNIEYLENTVRPVLDYVNDVSQVPRVEISLTPEQMNALGERIPSEMGFRNRYIRAFEEYLKDYRVAVSERNYDKVNKLRFVHYYYLKPINQLFHFVRFPYVFIIIQVDNAVIKAQNFEYSGKVNFVIPVLSSNKMYHFMMRRFIGGYNYFMMFNPNVIE